MITVESAFAVAIILFAANCGTVQINGDGAVGENDGSPKGFTLSNGTVAGDFGEIEGVEPVQASGFNATESTEEGNKQGLKSNPTDFGGTAIAQTSKKRDGDDEEKYVASEDSNSDDTVMVHYGGNGTYVHSELGLRRLSYSNDEINVTESPGLENQQSFQNFPDSNSDSDFNSTAIIPNVRELGIGNITQNSESTSNEKSDSSNNTFVVDYSKSSKLSLNFEGEINTTESTEDDNQQESHNLTHVNSGVADFNSTVIVQNLKQRNPHYVNESLEGAANNDTQVIVNITDSITSEDYQQSTSELNIRRTESIQYSEEPNSVNTEESFDTTWTSPINYTTSSSHEYSNETEEIVELCNPYGNTTYDSYTTNETSYCGCTDDIYCLRKCCQAGYYHRRVEDLDNDFFESVCIKNRSAVPFNLTVYDGYEPRFQWKNFTIGMLRCNRTTKRQYFKMDNAAAWMKYYVQANGTLYYPKSPFKFYDRSRFCVDEGEGLSVFLCYSPERQEVVIERFLTSAGMIISMPFLLCTFLVYLILPETNIHRKALMFYVMTLFLGYMILVGVQLNDRAIPDLFCKTLGYGIIFFFISSFFWMNVMCVDMWLTFSGLRGFKGQHSSELKRFLIYCVYALGTPFILLLIVFLVNTYGHPKSIFHPHLGTSRCFLDDGYPNLFYFYLPMAIIIAINILMFIMTALRIQKVKKETSMLKQSDNKRHSFEEDKQKFNLYVKLLFAMGINWIMEVISWAVGWAIPSSSTYVWYFTDFANAAYGLFIFFIFVFKRKTWVSLKKRYYIWRGQPHRAQALSTSNRTRTTREFSTTDTTLTSDYRMSDMKNGKQEERPLNQN